MERKELDIRTVNRNSLKDINNVKIDPNLTKQERIKSYVEQIGNPYCYLDGDIIVGISYADTDITLEDRLKAYVSGLG
ncbi:MAG: hypothetical protein J6I50_07210 [Clostridia bacterium]|nr:hypothetical protein [Clostridia bacterium]